MYVYHTPILSIINGVNELLTPKRYKRQYTSSDKVSQGTDVCTIFRVAYLNLVSTTNISSNNFLARYNHGKHIQAWHFYNNLMKTITSMNGKYIQT